VAFAKHPDVFDDVYIALISAGEVSGTLDKALERIADQQEKDAEIMGKVKGAMVYPLIVSLVMVGVIENDIHFVASLSEKKETDI
jgi:type IV pilus assembly protein PilC